MESRFTMDTGRYLLATLAIGCMAFLFVLGPWWLVAQAHADIRDWSAIIEPDVCQVMHSGAPVQVVDASTGVELAWLEPGGDATYRNDGPVHLIVNVYLQRDNVATARVTFDCNDEEEPPSDPTTTTMAPITPDTTQPPTTTTEPPTTTTITPEDTGPTTTTEATTTTTTSPPVTSVPPTTPTDPPPKDPKTPTTTIPTPTPKEVERQELCENINGEWQIVVYSRNVGEEWHPIEYTGTACGGVLPMTGVDVEPFAWAGAALTLSGLAMVAGSRIRRIRED